VMSVAGSAVSLAGIVAFTAWRGLDGWVAGRYLGELCTASVLLFPLRRVARWRGAADPRHGYGFLVGHGVAVAASLALRTAIDQGGLLALGHWDASRESVGFMGIGTLALSVVLVFPAALGQLLVPRFAAGAADRARVRAGFLGAARITALATVPVAAAGVLLCGPVLRAVFPAYAPAVPLLQVLLLSLPARAVEALAGGVLLAYNRNGVTVVYNVLMLAASWALYARYVPAHGALGAAWVLVAVEHVGFALYMATALRELARPSAAPAAA